MRTRSPRVRPRLTRQRLIDDFGLELARQLMERWGGHRLPEPFPVERAERDRRIVEALDAGDPGPEIAEREGVSPARVYQIGKRGAV